MAVPHRIVSLNIGMQNAGLAEFRTTSEGGLVLHAHRATELLADPAADASRIGQLKIAVKENADALHLKNNKVNYAIAAQSVFTRFVKLPPVGEDKIDQIVTFEAQQNVPFPIDEVVWDYQLVGSGADARMEVVLVAIKADLLDDINSTVEGAGLHTTVVDVAPMALFNAFRYNYSDLQGCSLVIDIGARTTNLIFVEPRKLFSRSIPIGGNTITAALAKDFNEPFHAAEERKKAIGFVSLGGGYAEPSDLDVSRASKIIRNTMTRLHSDITRSVSFYRAQQAGSQPDRVFLCGGSSSMPYTREFFNEKLQLPVEYFNPLRNVAVASTLNAEEIGKNAHLLGELVGLALRSVSACPMELNLLPQSVVRAHTLAQRRPYFITAGICVLLILVAGWFYFYRAADVKNIELEKVNQKISPLKNYENKFAAVRKDMKALQDTGAPLLQAASDRDYWAKIIDDLNARLPQRYIWVTVFDPGFVTADGAFNSVLSSEGAVSAAAAAPAPVGPGPAVKNALSLRIRGLYVPNPQGPDIVDEFAKKLGESPYLSAVKIAVRAQPTNDTWAYDYELQATLKSPISVQ
jgi:type IV pilus assembly protein PilM